MQSDPNRQIHGRLQQPLPDLLRSQTPPSCQHPTPHRELRSDAESTPLGLLVLTRHTTCERPDCRCRRLQPVQTIPLGIMSHVVVFNSYAKTVKIPTTPVKYLTEVRDEACQKFGVSKDQFTLKYVHFRAPCSQHGLTDTYKDTTTSQCRYLSR